MVVASFACADGAVVAFASSVSFLLSIFVGAAPQGLVLQETAQDVESSTPPHYRLQKAVHRCWRQCSMLPAVWQLFFVGGCSAVHW